MGVIVQDTIPTRNTPTVETFTQHTQDRVIVDGSNSMNYLNLGSYDQTVYKVMSAITAENLLGNPAIIRTELDLFIKYAEILTLNGDIPTGFEELNLYLGSLGV